MRELGLWPCQSRPFRPVTTIAGDVAATPDLVGRDFTAAAPASRLVGDITYIPTWEGWLYLATELDCYSKKVVGYAMADHMRTELVTDALSMAARNLDFIEGVTIFHSDRGCQYTSADFAVATSRPRRSTASSRNDRNECHCTSSPRSATSSPAGRKI